jgi:hypothetical protein
MFASLVGMKSQGPLFLPHTYVHGGLFLHLTTNPHTMATELPTPAAHRLLQPAVWNQTLTYEDYHARHEAQATHPETPANEHDAYLQGYMRLNWQRVKRLEKTTHLTPKLQAAAEGLQRKLIWVVLSEAWCGDAAQNLPIWALVAQQNPEHITLRILLRDENLEVMDQYLTNGGRAIPKLVCLDAATGHELGTWGPRPQAVQNLMHQLKAEGTLSPDEVKEHIQRWYNDDKSQTLLAEIAACLQAWGTPT